MDDVLALLNARLAALKESRSTDRVEKATAETAVDRNRTIGSSTGLLGTVWRQRQQFNRLTVRQSVS